MGSFAALLIGFGLGFLFGQNSKNSTKPEPK